MSTTCTRRRVLAVTTIAVALLATAGVRYVASADTVATKPVTAAAPAVAAAAATFVHPGVVGISVFLDDRAGYDPAITRFRARAASYIYVTADGAQPKYPPAGGIDTRSELLSYWQGQSTFVDGLAQETCRDFVHTGYGISAIAHVAETTRIQGADLYPELQDRLRHTLGLHAKFENGTAVPSNICGGKVTKGLGQISEVAYNALHNRMGIAMANTQTWTETRRPQGTNNLFVAWETLTHANNPN